VPPASGSPIWFPQALRVILTNTTSTLLHD
jgi:hypothetical protein